MLKKYPKYILTFTFLLLLFLGGFWGQKILFSWAVSFLLSLILFFIYFKYGSLKLPKTFFLYVVFLVFFLLHLLWSKDLGISIKYFFHFFSGGLIWLLIYNLKNKKYLLPNFELLIILLGLSFGLWFLYKKIFGIWDVMSYNLVSYSVESLDHHHIGDLWSVVMGVILYRLFDKSKKRPLLWAMALFGLYLLIASGSRSAYVALSAGMLYLLTQINRDNKKRIALLLMLLGMLAVFFIVTTGKGLISHRLFYLQGLSGIYHNPFGVGVGNFSVISLDSVNHLFGINAYAGVADNIFLEMLTGMGILGAVFIYWFIKVFGEIFGDKLDKNKLPRLVFVILTVNFFFNYVYFIPTMLWLWFVSIGLLSYPNSNSKNVVKCAQSTPGVD